MPLVPDVPLLEPVVEPVLDIPLPLDVPFPMWAFARTHWPPIDEPVVELAADVPDVPVVLLLPPGSRQPVTVTVLLELLDDVPDVPVCAYAAIAPPTTSAIAAPRMLRFMRVPPFSGRARCNGVTSRRPSQTPMFRGDRP